MRHITNAVKGKSNILGNTLIFQEENVQWLIPFEYWILHNRQPVSLEEEKQCAAKLAKHFACGHED